MTVLLLLWYKLIKSSCCHLYVEVYFDVVDKIYVDADLFALDNFPY